MSRLWPVLLVLLSLWPSPAAASGRAPEHRNGGVLRRAGLEYAHQVVRSTGGLELLQSVEARLPRGANGSSAGTHGPFLLSGHERIAARVRLLVRETSDQAAHAWTPLCERLPYYATAPPARR